MRKNNLTGALVLSLLASGCTNFNSLNGNFHAVSSKGRADFYRSGQLSESKLKELIEKYGIKTLVYLRDPKKSPEIFGREQRLCCELGVEFVALKGRTSPNPDYIVRVLDALDGVRYPLLAHCRGGVDRTGMLSAIYLANQGLDGKTALSQLTRWEYGNVPLNPRRKQGVFFGAYDKSGKSFRDFVLDKRNNLRANGRMRH